MFLDFNFKTMPSILLQLNLVCLIHNFVKVHLLKCSANQVWGKNVALEKINLSFPEKL